MLKHAAIKSRLAISWKRIPPRERLMLTLLFFEGLTFVETARALGCSVREVEQTVEIHLAKLSGALVAAGRRADRESRRRAA